MVRGAVLEISAVSATFFQNFSSFWTGLGSCFRSFMDYSYPRPVSYQHMAIVHYANLVWGDIMLKNKNDGSYWICGEGVGTEQKTVSGETEYTVTCSSKFVPYEFPANEFSK